MKRFLLPLVLVGLLAQTGQASYYTEDVITVAASAIGFTAAKLTPAGAPPMQTAQCYLETAEIRYYYSGVAPTASVGIPLQIGQTITFTRREDMVNFKAIRTGSTSGSLSCQLWAP